MELIKLPTIEEQALTMYSELSNYASYLEALKTAHEQAIDLQYMHDNGDDVADTAKRLRLAMSKHRNGLEKVRKDLKEDALKYGQAIDKAAKPIREAFELLEEKMKNIEEYEARQEAKRIADLEALRLGQLKEVGCQFPEVFKALGEMNADEFDALLESQRLAVIAQKAEAERKEREAIEAEAKRVAELEEAKRIASEAQAKLEAERQEREVKEAQARVEAERIAKEMQAKIDAERKAREAIEAEAKRKQDIERAKLEAERQEAERLANASDTERLSAWACQLYQVIEAMPSVSGEKAQAVAKAKEKLTAIYDYFK